MLLQQDPVRMNSGSKSTWLFATTEGDRNLADLAWRWGWWGGRSWLGGAYESESHCCLGFHPALTAPVHQISFTQQIPPWWETEGRQLKADWLTEHVAKAPTVLILIIDQMIKADEETFFFFFLSESCNCAFVTCLERAAKRSILSIRPESSPVSHAE